MDTQYGVPFAREAANLARSFGKPVTRVYVSHDHPDHFFGSGEFDAPVYALDSTKAVIEAAGAHMLAGNKALVGDFVPDQVTVPTGTVTPGIETIDGVRFEFGEVLNTEAAAMLTVAFPNDGILIAQDLIYNNVHLFLAEHHLDGWSDAVLAPEKQGYTDVLPGHGVPGGPELFDFVADYLTTAEQLLATETTPAGLKSALIAAHPSLGGLAVLDIQNNYLFPAP